MITLNTQDNASLAGGIASYWHEWNSQRVPALSLWEEIDRYITATDTTNLEGGEHFDHKTHIPVTSELYEDLVAIVYSTLFPHEDWMGWKGFNIDAITKAVRTKVLGYIKEAHMLNGFDVTFSKIVEDLCRYGNCFVQATYVDETVLTEENIEAGYSGPKPVRISPYDIVFNPTAKEFAKTPKIVRSVIALSEFIDLYEQIGAQGALDEKEYERILSNRTAGQNDYSERYKEAQYVPEGFGSIQNYFMSGYVELLWFYGDILDGTEVRRNRCVIVADRDLVVLDKEELHPNIFKGGWSDRPDNLWSQGPLDKVVGINYMINHRENGKNDAIDKFIHPDRAFVGDVEEIYDEDTGQTKYLLPEGGSVSDIRPDSTVLTFDNQIIMHREMARQSARLPQQLSGFRTAGEKTATEVQSLNDGAFRGFINKAAQLERTLLEPFLRAEIKIAKDNFSSIIKILGEDEEGILLTSEITEEDLAAKGKLIPFGSRRFARQLQQQQGVMQIANTNLAGLIGQHLNTYNLAKTVETLFGFDQFEMVQKLAAIDEQLEAQEKQMMAEQQAVMQSSQPTSLEMQMEDQYEKPI